MNSKKSELEEIGFEDESVDVTSDDSKPKLRPDELPILPFNE